ncbi:MAG TPA: SGNH/GDSL hydrolase family protein [Methylomirabilota bacterium]|nr:SGNH/GDSL hydrolase family protein [Methylomirabilota bacterium]
MTLAATALLTLLAGCARDRTATLPADRDAPILYVALGDSTVEGVGASGGPATYVARLHERLRAHYPRARVANLGVAGATSADVRAAQVERAVSLRPQLVTLSVGPNDITAGVSVDDYERNVDTVLRRLSEAGRPVVVVNLLPDLAVTPRFAGHPGAATVGRRTVAFNDALRRTVHEHGAGLVDLYGPSRQEVPRQPWLLSADGYHPSDAGYARWAELMWQGVEARLAR